MKKRIVVYLFSLNGGGAERTMINIINHLDKKKFDVKLIIGSEQTNSKNQDYLHLLSEHVDVRFLNFKRNRYVLWKLTKEVRRIAPNVLFTTLTDNNILLSITKFLSRTKAKLVLRETNHKSLEGKVKGFYRQVMRTIYNTFADNIIALSHGVKADLVNNFAINEDKISVIYNPIDIKYIEKSIDGTDDQLQLSDNKYNVIAVGKLTYQKGFDILINSIKIVKETKDVQLTILGKGALEDELKSLTEELGVEDSVKFLGFQTNPYVYMKNSDLFVLSSRYEGFGHVVTEALVTKTPIVSTDCNSGPREILGDNVFGLLANAEDSKDLADKINKLLDNPTVIDINKSYVRSKEFDVITIIKEYEDVFLT